MAWLAQLLVIAGFAALSLSMPRHHREMLGRAPAKSASTILRLAGWSLLALGLAAAMAGAGAAFGIVLWVGLLSTGTLAISALLTYRNQGQP